MLSQIIVEFRYLALAGLMVLGGRYVGRESQQMSKAVGERLEVVWTRSRPSPAVAGYGLLTQMSREAGRLPLSSDRPVNFEAAKVKENIKYLAEEIGPRPAGSQGEKQAADYISKSLSSMGYKVSVSPPIPVPGRTGYTRNVVATCSQMHQGRWKVVVAAHYDTKGPKVPGANDNGSGVSTLLEVARVIQQHSLPYKLTFLFCGGEEHLAGLDSPSLIGSRAYVGQYRRQGNNDIAAMINVDMVGVGSSLCMDGAGPGAERLENILVSTANRLCLGVRAYKDTHGSDHIAFGWAGIPAVRLQRLPAPRRDTPADVVKYIQDEALVEVGQLVMSVLCGLTDEDLERVRRPRLTCWGL